MVSGFTAFIILLIVVIIFTSSEKMVPLYKDLSAEEAGRLKKSSIRKGVF